ncbi:MAG: hypothetical protein HQL06_11710 [Nitrospirae bacterium]|nr:hypothetical protein [Nitrospirota bacterium]
MRSLRERIDTEHTMAFTLYVVIISVLYSVIIGASDGNSSCPDSTTGQNESAVYLKKIENAINGVKKIELLDPFIILAFFVLLFFYQRWIYKSLINYENTLYNFKRILWCEIGRVVLVLLITASTFFLPVGIKDSRISMLLLFTFLSMYISFMVILAINLFPIRVGKETQ